VSHHGAPWARPGTLTAQARIKFSGRPVANCRYQNQIKKKTNKINHKITDPSFAFVFPTQSNLDEDTGNDDLRFLFVLACR